MAASNNRIRVVELFAGVGGFRVGLSRASKQFEFVWANQWEPSSGDKQHAAWVYEYAFFRKGKKRIDEKKIARELANVNIEDIAYDPARIDAEIPNHDLLTGGFPCQDYSVARPRRQSAGIEGKKGVLWWSIYNILERKIKTGHPVKYLFLENVDRLLKSPAEKRGRDFAIMLSCLNSLGYTVEWRVVNAGEYGFPQRRKRIFILGFLKGSEIEQTFRDVVRSRGNKGIYTWMTGLGVHAKSFPIKSRVMTGEFNIDPDPTQISKNFTIDANSGSGTIDVANPFQNAGIMANGRVYTAKVEARTPKEVLTLGDIISETDEKKVDPSFYISRTELKKWKNEKGAHRYERTSKSGHTYMYSEGPVAFPDYLDRPSRTIVTGEGGRGASRFKHVIDITKKKGGKPRKIGKTTYTHRRLIPQELEALCMFDREHTKWMWVPDKQNIEPVSDNKRAFFMGNALVCGAIQQVGKTLTKTATPTQQTTPSTKTHQKDKA